MKTRFAPDGILVNALQAAPTAAGVGRYAFEIARGLGRLRRDVRILARADMAGAFAVEADRVIPLELGRSSWRRILYEQFSLPKLATGAHLVHFPDSACFFRKGIPCLMTVHDLSYFARAGTFTRAQTFWKKNAARISSRRALCVICSSRHTAEDVRTFLSVPEERIRVVYPGVTVHGGDPIPPDVRCPEEPFILGVGTLEPRKNFVRLIEAIARLRREGLPLKLVIAGKRGWLYDKILRAPREFGVQDAVTFAGYCTDAQLKWLYQRAGLLAYVSLYEGFGFPPLEAMAFGLPVVATHVSSIPEVCADAAQYASPDSVVEIAAAIRNVWSDESLRMRLITAGRSRVNAFSWSRAAAEVSAVIDEVARP